LGNKSGKRKQAVAYKPVDKKRSGGGTSDQDPSQAKQEVDVSKPTITAAPRRPKVLLSMLVLFAMWLAVLIYLAIRVTQS